MADSPTNTITEATVERAADLIKIHLTNEEEAKITQQLNTVIQAVAVLNEIDTRNVPITSQTHGLKNVLAEDIAEPGLDIADYPNRANLQNGYFVVNQVL